MEDRQTLLDAADLLDNIAEKQRVGDWDIPWYDEIPTPGERWPLTATMAATLRCLAEDSIT